MSHSPESVVSTSNNDVEYRPPGARFEDLPVEVLTEILKNLITYDSRHELLLDESYVTLAKLARVSRQFYTLATPLLYRETEVYILDSEPYPALEYLGTPSVRLIRHVRTLRIGLYDAGLESYDLSKDACDNLYEFLSKCYQFLLAATSLQNIVISFHVFYPTSEDRAFRHHIMRINRLLFRILRYIESLQLQTLTITPTPDSEITPVMKILERKVTSLELEGTWIDFDDWVDRLPYLANLSSVLVCRLGAETTEFDDRFWIGLSQLPNLKTITSAGVPLSSALSTIHFPHVVSLEFALERVKIVDWASSVKFILRQMPNLEDLSFGASNYEVNEVDELTNAIGLTHFNCPKLKKFKTYGASPNHFIETIGIHCTNLERLQSNTDNIDDDDLRSLSRCTQLRQLILPCPTEITDLSCLTLLSKLQELELHCSAGPYITTEFLIEIARSCPLLDKILLSDQFHRKMGDVHRPFEENVGINFMVGKEMFRYIEVRMGEEWEFLPYMLEEYVIHVNRLRKDRGLV